MPDHTAQVAPMRPHLDGAAEPDGARRRLDALLALERVLAAGAADDDLARGVDLVATALDRALTLALGGTRDAAPYCVRSTARDGARATAEARALAALARVHDGAAARGGQVAAPFAGDDGALVAPLVASGAVLGALVVEPGDVPRDDADLLAAVASRLACAVALTSAQRREEAARGRLTDVEGSQGEFVSIVSHDLRNPLSAIVMSVSLLLRRARHDAASDAVKHLEVIKRSAERMNLLIQNVVDAMCGPAAITIAPQAQSVAPLVADSVRLSLTQASSRSVELTSEVDDALSAVLVDRERVVQTLTNLITAGIRLAGKGGAVVVRATAGGPGEVRFAVSESGAAIPAEDLARVFDRDFWARRNARASSGVGLAVARAIVEAHGGRMWVDNGPSGGSTFVFTLPCADADALDDARAASTA